MPSSVRPLVLGALVGYAIAVAVAAMTPNVLPAAASHYVAAIVIALTLTVLALVPEGRLLWREPLLFVPTGWALGVTELLVLLPAPVRTPTVFNTDALLQLRGGGPLPSLWVIATGLVIVIVWLLHAAWLTPVVLAVARGQGAAAALGPAFRAAPAHLIRVTQACLVGNLPLLALLPMLLIAGVMGPLGIIVVLLPMLVGTTLWNLLTAPLLLQVFDAPARHRPGFRRMLAAAWGAPGRWRGLVCMQLALAGIVVVLPWRWSVNWRWLGAYGGENAWYEIASDRGGPSPVLEIVLACTACAMAIVVKLRIARTLPAAGGSEPRG